MSLRHRLILPAVISLTFGISNYSFADTTEGAQSTRDAPTPWEEREGQQTVPPMEQSAERSAEDECAESDDPAGCADDSSEQMTHKPAVPIPDDGAAREDTQHGAGGY